MKARHLAVGILSATALLVFPQLTWADGDVECTGYCGTPDESGGGGGCGCGGGGSILVNNTDVGDTYQYSDDFDMDGIEDDFDNCPFLANVGQLDSDGDSIGDLCDSCARVVNPMQLDTDGDGEGDLCDNDRDNDGILNGADNCALVPNPLQVNTDADDFGDACDTDDDNDRVLDIKDNCPLVSNPQQLNSDPNKYGDACDADMDLDNVPDSRDNCPSVANEKQLDTDGDKIGDLCDGDLDADGVANAKDNCVSIANPSQTNVDRDDLGDACDPRFCFVIRQRDGSFDEKQCLDPKATFRVFSPDDKIVVGEKSRLRLFANRVNRAIEYTWVVVDRPAGSTAVVEAPRGLVNSSSTYEYFYLKGKNARFAPDVAGTYKLRLSANLVFADTANPNWPTDSSYLVTLTAENGDQQSGCSLVAHSAPLPIGVLLSLLGLMLIRRRR